MIVVGETLQDVKPIDVPLIKGTDVQSRVEFKVDGYMRYYNRSMFIPTIGPVNQVEEWKKYLQILRDLKTDYGEFKEQKKSDISAHAEVRVVFVWPAFYDPLTDSYEAILPLLREEYKREGIDFPQTKTVKGKRAVAAFHKKYKELFAVPQKY